MNLNVNSTVLLLVIEEGDILTSSSSMSRPVETDRHWLLASEHRRPMRSAVRWAVAGKDARLSRVGGWCGTLARQT